jgi:hypothetical protein
MHSLSEFKGWLNLEPCLEYKARYRNLSFRLGSRFCHSIAFEHDSECGIQRDLAVHSSFFAIIGSRVSARMQEPRVFPIAV